MDFYGTIGPACADVKLLQQMVEAGMTGIRMNLSHGPLAAHKDWLVMLHKAGVKKLLIDLQGPELRIGRLPQPLSLADIRSAAHKGQHDPGNAAIGGDGKVLLVLGGQGGHLDIRPRCCQAFAALQHSAPHYGAHECFRLCGVHPRQQLAVIQQQRLPGLHAVHQRGRAGDALHAQTHGLPGGQGQRLRQTADA